MTGLAMILAAAERHPDRIAIEDANGDGVTYRDLIARARAAGAAHRRGQIAGACAAGAAHQHGAMARGRAIGAPQAHRRGEVIELVAERTTEFVAGCLGAWIAGVAWMPIDPHGPVERAQAIRARVARMRTDEAGTDDQRRTHLDDVAPTGERREDLAYVIATSGSTGEPKLVLVAHRGLPALLTAQIDAFALSPGARALWLHSPLFDASVSDWGTALAAGATLVIPSATTLASPAQLRAELVTREITHVDLPPSLLAYLPPTDPPASLRVVVLGGEACPVDELCALARRVRVVVVYGPTEATVCSSLVVVDPDRWRRPLIGAPLPGVGYDTVDGELWISGDGLALGYAGDPEETARCFVEREGRRWYRTGDRVERTEHGLAFLGRVDRQRKIGGHRVELDEIEMVVRRAPGCRDAAVVTRAGRVGRHERVVAYCELDANASIDEVRRWVSEQLPTYMMPAQLVAGPLPRTVTGKVDRAALGRAVLGGAALGGSTATRPLAITACDALTDELRVLWCDALDVDSVHAEDRFRETGGDSLAALTLQAALTARALRLDAGVLATNPTFRALVEHVGSAPEPVPLTVAMCEERGRALLASDPVRAGVLHGNSVLITGATGLLGTELVRAWRATGRHVIALVRAHDEGSARRRLRVDDLEIVRGDVSAPNLGLSDTAWQALAARVGSIVHAAARIDLAGDWDAHAGTNVRGTHEVARLVAASGAAFHFISTLSVFVSTDRATGRHEESSRPHPAARVFGGYAQTKVAAEAIARDLRDRARPTTIHRLGLLVSETPRDTDQLAMTIRGLARLGAIPAAAEQLQLDLTPVSGAADAITALALRAEGSSVDDTHHLAAARATTFGELVTAIRAAGIELVELPASAWAERARAWFADPDVAMAYLALGRVHADDDARARLRRFDLFLATDADFDVGRTDRLVADLGVVRAPARLDRIVAGVLGSVLR